MGSDGALEPVGYTLRQLAAAGNGFAPGSIAGNRKVIMGGRMFTMEDRFVPAADFAELRAEYEKLLADQAADAGGTGAGGEPGL